MALINIWFCYWDFLPGLESKTCLFSTEPIHTLCIVSFCFLGPVYIIKSCPRKRVTPPAELTFASVYMRKKPTHLSKPRAFAHTLIVPSLHPHISFLNVSVQCKGNSRIRCGAFSRSLSEPRTTVTNEGFRLVTWRVFGSHVLSLNKEKE